MLTAIYTFFKELKANEKKEEKSSFSTEAKVFCVRALHVAIS